MFCPNCQNTLRERQRDGVLLDVCPGCSGVWLDRGELEKLTSSERSYYRPDNDDDDGDGRRRTQRYEQRAGPAYDDQDRPRYEGRPGHGHPQKKRGGFLENIFGEAGGRDD